MIEFKKYEGSALLTDLGTVASQIGTKGTIKFVAKNFNNPEKRVVLVAENDKGESAVISCSKSLSDYLRKAKEEGAKKEELLAGLLDLNIMEGEEEVPFITMPAGEQTKGITVTELRKAKKVHKIEALEEIPW